VIRMWASLEEEGESCLVPPETELAIPCFGFK